MSVNVLVALDSMSQETLSRIIPQVAPGIDVTNLKTLDAPTRIQTTAVEVGHRFTEQSAQMPLVG